MREKRDARAWVVRAMLVSLLVYGVLSGVSVFRELLSHPIVDKEDFIARYVERFTPLKRLLPSHGVVGYTTGREVDNIYLSGNETAKYYLAQYALIPVVVDYGTHYRFVIGNFDRPFDEVKDLIKGNVAPVEDLGNGVVLLENRDI